MSGWEWPYLVPALFLVLAVSFGYRAGTRQGDDTGPGGPPAIGRRVARRIAILFLLVGLFLLLSL